MCFHFERQQHHQQGGVFGKHDEMQACWQVQDFAAVSTPSSSSKGSSRVMVFSVAAAISEAALLCCCCTVVLTLLLWAMCTV
jgi:hypothetical protein